MTDNQVASVAAQVLRETPLPSDARVGAVAAQVLRTTPLPSDARVGAVLVQVLRRIATDSPPSRFSPKAMGPGRVWRGTPRVLADFGLR